MQAHSSTCISWHQCHTSEHRVNSKDAVTHSRAGLTRVLIVEDEALFREMLTAALSRHKTIEVVGTASTGEEALRLSVEKNPDVVLMDIELGSEPDGIKSAHLIKAAHPSIGIVILSMHHDKEYLASLPDKRAGGWSFLLKQSVRDSMSLVRAIEGAAWGLVSMDPAIMEHLRPRKRSILERLTQRQLLVLREMSAGYSDGAIAGRMGVSEPSVRRLARSIYEDLGIAGDQALDQRIKAILTYLRETSRRAGV